MNVACPHCGTEYEVEKHEMYRYSTCEVCGKGFVAGAATSLQKSESGAGLSEEDKLRMAIDPKPAKVPASAPRGVITAAEERVRMYETMKQKKARAKMLRNLVDSVMLLSLLATVVALCLWWQSHRNKVAAEAARIRAEAEAESLRLAEERDRMIREQREKDRLEREREDSERRAMFAAQDCAAREAREAAERERRGNIERYNLLRSALKANEFDLFTKSVTNKMESAGGELCYLFPSDKSIPPLYHVVFETNGARRISRLEENGQADETDRATFDAMLKNFEYLVVKGEKVYFKSARKPPGAGLLNIKQASDPAESFFGTLAPALRMLKPAYDELTFDIFFTPKGSSKKFFVENVQFGCPWSVASVIDAIEKNCPPKTAKSSGSGRIKKFKRTVKTYSGGMIKQGIDGITYVPKSPPPERRAHYISSVPNVIYRSSTRSGYDYNSHARWQTLYNRALQEDADEAAFYERQRSEHSERIKSSQYAEERRWQEKVDETFRNGTLSYKIRKAQIPADPAK